MPTVGRGIRNTGHRTHHHQVAVRNNQAVVIGEDIQITHARV